MLQANTSQIWNSFVEIMDQIPDSSALPPQVVEILYAKRLREDLFTVSLQNGKLMCGEIALDISHSKMMHRLFQEFIAADGLRVSQADLVRAIYDVEEHPYLTQRHRDCFRHNTVKLVSRARLVMTQQLGTFRGVALEWFPFDARSKTWRLYRVVN